MKIHIKAKSHNIFGMKNVTFNCKQTAGELCFNFKL